VTEREPRNCSLGQTCNLATPKYQNFQAAPVRAELYGSETATAAGLSVRGHAPVLVLCRELIAAGLDPDRAMEVFRGATLALHVRTIGRAARLEINSHGTAFVALRARRTAPPMRHLRSPAVRHRREAVR
jgi:hypothetical protein